MPAIGRNARASPAVPPIDVVCWGIAAFAAMLLLPLVLNDPDTWWHVAAGRWMLAMGRVPVTDPFSWTLAGQPWSAHEWLAELLMALGFRMAGWSGVLALTAGCAAAALSLLAMGLRRALPAGWAALWLALAIACAAPELLARPHVIALPCMVIWAVALARSQQAGRSPGLWLLPVMAVWANLHGGFMVGLVFAAGLAAEAVLARPALWFGWAAFLIAAAAMATLTPQGWHTLLFPFQLTQLRSLAGITEWQPIRWDRIQPIELMIGFVFYLIVARKVRLSALRSIMLLGLFWQACAHSRNQLLAGVFVPVLFAMPMARRLRIAPDAVPATPGRLTGCLLLASAMLAIRLDWPLTRRDGDDAPIAALASVSPAIRHQPVVNDYNFGGYLIFAGVRPYVDGRADLYGDPFLAHYAELFRPDGAALADLLRHPAIGWTLFKPDSPAVETLDRLPGWTRSYADRFAVVHVRTALPPP